MASQDWFDKDFYKVLGVSKDVSEADLKKTYRKLARKYHPDSNQGDAKAEAKFKEISEAHSVLSDPEQRKEYDQIRAMGSGARFTAGGRPGQPGGFEDVFGGMFGGDQRGSSISRHELRRPPRRHVRRRSGVSGFRGGSDTRRGMSRRTRRSTSSRPPRARRSRCRPTTASRSRSRSPPASRRAEDQAQGKGRAEPRRRRARRPRGHVTVRKHPVFERDGLNLRVDVPVTFTEAALGATIEVPTLGGDPVKLRVAPGTPSGRVLRVKGRGVTSAKGTGDLLAEVQVAVPAQDSG